ERLAPEVAVQEHRQPEAERQLEDRGDDRVDEGVANGDAENAVVPQPLEVLRSDEVPRHADLGVGHREQHALDERIGDEQPEQDPRGQQEGDREPALVLQQSGDRAARRRTRVGGSRRNGIAYGHAAISLVGRNSEAYCAGALRGLSAANAPYAYTF